MKKIVLIFFTILGLSACSILYEQDPRSLSTVWKDKQLTVKIIGISNKAPYAGELRVNAVTYDGNVVLIGQSLSEELKSSLIETVRVMEGVKRIYDQIHIKQLISLSQKSRDTWITTRIKSSLLTKKQLLNANIKVVTEDSEVFLFGYVSQDQALEATEVARNIKGVERVIQAWF